MLSLNWNMITLARVLVYLLIGAAGCQAASAKQRAFDVRKENVSIRFHILFPLYGRIHGRFERVRGQFDLNHRNPTRSTISVEVETASINSNHQVRDAYLRSPALLSAREFPTAVFQSDTITQTAKNAVRINGRLTLRGITQPITVNAFLIRNAFQGTTSFYLSDFGINGLLGFMFAKLHLTMRIEAGR